MTAKGMVNLIWLGMTATVSVYRADQEHERTQKHIRTCWADFARARSSYRLALKNDSDLGCDQQLRIPVLSIFGHSH